MLWNPNDPLKDFDIIGFSLGYELCYTNVLNMLDLAEIPVLAAERDNTHPFIIAGGSSYSESGADGGLYRSLCAGRRRRSPG